MKRIILMILLLSASQTTWGATEYSCAAKRYAESAEDVSKMFEDVLGVANVRPGMVLAELPGNGNRVFLKIKQARTFQLQVNHRGTKGDLPAKVCATKNALYAAVDGSSLGYGNYTVTITNPKGLGDQIKMVGSGMLNQLINWDYKVTSAVK